MIDPNDDEVERRKLPRFALRALAVLRTLQQSERRTLQLYTRDISSGGAFFSTDTPLLPGTAVIVTLFLFITALRERYGHPPTVRITVQGRVVRSSREGMAVVFDGDYEVSGVSDSAQDPFGQRDPAS